jgi:superfamily I DNA/RNA helicase
LEKALSGTSIDRAFFQDEIEDCIQWKDISSFPEYEAVERRGRRARLSAAGRNGLWSAYEVYLAELAAQNCRDLGSMRMNAARRSAGLAESEKYDCVIVDEVQDLPLSTLIMLTNLTKGTAKEKNMMLIGDAGQAIYNRGFRWSDVGLRFGGGNVYTLAESERSTQQILDFARLFFGNTEMNQVGETYDIPTASKSGECPRIVDGLEVDERLFEWICSDIEARLNSGINPDKIAIIAHSHNRLASVAAALRSSGILTVFQGTKAFYSKGSVKLITSHAAKGLEFSEVYLPDVNDGIYPFFKNRGLAPDERLEKDAQDAQLLYVAATRAADRLTVLYDRSPSPFIENARSAAISVDGARF